MGKKRGQKAPEKNYLDYVPRHSPGLRWDTLEDGRIQLTVKRRGWVNSLAHTLFKAPENNYVTLDDLGSFVWKQIDGRRSITAIGEMVEKAFGQDAEPVYQRLAEFVKMLSVHNFVKLEDARPGD